MDNSTITTISIRNFKGIEDLQLNAKKLNAIIGKCGSGNRCGNARYYRFGL